MDNFTRLGFDSEQYLRRVLDDDSIEVVLASAEDTQRSTTTDLENIVFEKYPHFIRTAKDVEDLTSELLSIRHGLQSLKGVVTSIVAEDDTFTDTAALTGTLPVVNAVLDEFEDAIFREAYEKAAAIATAEGLKDVGKREAMYKRITDAAVYGVRRAPFYRDTETTLSVLCKIGRTNTARLLFLECQSQWVESELGHVHSAGAGPVTYVRLVTDVVVSCIRHGFTQYRASFKGTGGMSMLAQWATQQVERGMVVVKRRLHTISGLEEYLQCVLCVVERMRQLDLLGLSLLPVALERINCGTDLQPLLTIRHKAIEGRIPLWVLEDDWAPSIHQLTASVPLAHAMCPTPITISTSLRKFFYAFDGVLAALCAAATHSLPPDLLATLETNLCHACGDYLVRVEKDTRSLSSLRTALTAASVRLHLLGLIIPTFQEYLGKAFHVSDTPRMSAFLTEEEGAANPPLHFAFVVGLVTSGLTTEMNERFGLGPAPPEEDSDADEPQAPPPPIAPPPPMPPPPPPKKTPVAPVVVVTPSPPPKPAPPPKKAPSPKKAPKPKKVRSSDSDDSSEEEDEDEESEVEGEEEEEEEVAAPVVAVVAPVVVITAPLPPPVAPVVVKIIEKPAPPPPEEKTLPRHPLKVLAMLYVRLWDLQATLTECTTIASELPYAIKRAVLESLATTCLFQKTAWTSGKNAPAGPWDKATVEKHLEAVLFFKSVFDEMLTKTAQGALRSLVTAWRDEYSARAANTKLGAPKPPMLATDAVLEKIVGPRLGETLGPMTTRTYKDLKLAFVGEKGEKKK